MAEEKGQVLFLSLDSRDPQDRDKKMKISERKSKAPLLFFFPNITHGIISLHKIIIFPRNIQQFLLH